MTASHVRALSGRAGALLGAVALLVLGCTTACAGSGPRPGQAAGAHETAVASSSSRLAHRIAATTGPSSVRHASGSRIARPPSLQCAYSPGHPVAHRAAPVCACCNWCACAWACCGCGPGHWRPQWSPRSRLAWQCCSSWQWPPGEGAALIRSDCWPGCRSLACPAGRRASAPWPARAAGGSIPARSPGGARAGAS
jgi:hypothetical protein